MKKVIPFSKEISFQTRIAEITDIEITHDLEKTPLNTIEGNFFVNGKYKMTDASVIEENFSYDLPFIIEVDDKYDLEDVKIKISDFFFEIIDEDILKVNVEVELSEVKERELEKSLVEQLEDEEEADLLLDRCYDEEKTEEVEVEEEQPSADALKVEKIEVQPIDILDSAIPKALETPTVYSEVSSSDNITLEKASDAGKSISDIFTSVHGDEDTFKAYYVYIVRENDTLDSILNRYQVSKEEVSQYNDLNDLKIGSKLVLPCSKNE